MSFPVPLYHFFGKNFILLFNDFNILGSESCRILRGAHHRLHAELIKAQIRHVKNILSEIGIGVGEGSPHVVAFAFAGVHQLPEFRKDCVVAAISLIINPCQVVDFLSSVETQNNVAHLSVGEFYYVIVY